MKLLKTFLLIVPLLIVMMAPALASGQTRDIRERKDKEPGYYYNNGKGCYSTRWNYYVNPRYCECGGQSDKKLFNK